MCCAHLPGTLGEGKRSCISQIRLMGCDFGWLFGIRNRERAALIPLCIAAFCNDEGYIVVLLL